MFLQLIYQAKLIFYKNRKEVQLLTFNLLHFYHLNNLDINMLDKLNKKNDHNSFRYSHQKYFHIINRVN